MILKARYVAPADGEAIEHGAIRLERGRIVEVGPASQVAHTAGAEMIDYGDAVILPGLVNAHTHLELSFLHGRFPPGIGFVPWLQAVAAHLIQNPPSQERIETSCRAGIGASLAAGTTLVADITRFPTWTRPAAAAAPLRFVSYGEVIAVGSRRDQLADQLNRAASPEFAGDRLRVGVSPHAPYTVEPGGLRECARRAAEANLPVCIHLAESKEEADFTREAGGPLADFLRSLRVFDASIPASGVSPVEVARAAGLLTPTTVVAHANYVSDEDIKTLADTGASVAYCPRTHASFGHPPHRFRDMLAAGVNVCIGTDSLASNPSLSVLDELRSLRRTYPAYYAPGLLAMGTRAGAAALGWAGDVGTITPGKFADLVVLPLENGSERNGWSEVFESDAQPLATFIAGESVGTPSRSQTAL
jgi:cytosine/adenosine deaminase-related metal-dependent hydrolase